MNFKYIYSTKISELYILYTKSKRYNSEVEYIKDNLIFIAIGLVISGGVIFLIYYFDTTIKTSEEIENKLGLTVMGIVPKVEKE